jgi:hypothetical protein
MGTLSLFWIECGLVLGVAFLTAGLARLVRLPGPSSLAVAAAALTQVVH